MSGTAQSIAGMIAAQGPIGALTARIDAASPLGPMDGWSPTLSSTVRLMLPSAAQIVLFWGPELCALYNGAYAPTIGDKHPRVLGRPAREGWAELWDDLEPLLRSVMEEGRTIQAKDRPFYIERDGDRGEQVFFDISYSPVFEADGSIGGVLCIVNETTARIRAEAEAALRQTQKMETLGQLTGGVAHDFNNLLQIVTGNLELLQRGLDKDQAKLCRAVDHALTGAERAALLTQRLLAFSRRQPLSPERIDPNRLVRDMSDMLSRTVGEAIEVETIQSARVWPVEIDIHQMENALLDLAVNARDAMPDGGKLTVEVANTHIDADYAAQEAEVTPGQYVLICMTDSGEGMDADTLSHAIEPFFTTKEVGHGTGLGLSMVYGFVKQSGGHIRVYSEAGHGTTVRIYLPRFHGPLPDNDTGRARHSAPQCRGHERVLVCEDDERVRTYAADALRELGYAVVEAGTGTAALEALDSASPPIDLLFTDVVLPGGMNGADVAREAQARRPDLKVLFATGFARNAIFHQGRLDPGVELLTKPFTYAKLAVKVREMLDREGPRRAG